MPSTSSSASHRSHLRRRHTPPASRRKDAKVLPPDADAALMLAAISLVRTLRKANAHALLHGGNGAVVILAPGEQDLRLLKPEIAQVLRAGLLAFVAACEGQAMR